MSNPVGVRAPAPDHRVVFTGQSRNLRPIVPPDYLERSPTKTFTFPARSMSGRRVPWAVPAINGAGWTTLLATPSHLADMEMQPTRATDVHAVLQGGESEFINNVTNGPGVIALLNTYVALLRGYGYSTVTVLTVPGSSFITGVEDTSRLYYNAALLADGGATYDYVVDIDVPPLTYYFGNPMYTDNLHPSVAGAKEIATLLSPTLDTILA